MPDIPERLQDAGHRLEDDWNVAAVRRGLLDSLMYSVGKGPEQATDRDWFVATALFARSRAVERWLSSLHAAHRGSKHVYYLSLEFLIGRLLLDTLNNLGLRDVTEKALSDLGIDFGTTQE